MDISVSSLILVAMLAPGITIVFVAGLVLGHSINDKMFVELILVGLTGLTVFSLAAASLIAAAIIGKQVPLTADLARLLLWFGVLIPIEGIISLIIVSVIYVGALRASTKPRN